MPSSLVQFSTGEAGRGLALINDAGEARKVTGIASTLDLAQTALAQGVSLQAAAEARLGDSVRLDDVQLLPPVDHADPGQVLVSGTGLTHLGSAEGRDEMHRAAKADPSPTDSMRMFTMGLRGGKPPVGEVGVQPEWFYKGDGSIIAAPGGAILSPAFGLDAGEEPELAGIYVIAADGTPVRLGFALGNDFSDHITERGNYLWLAHSKLRQAALGPELLLGDLPADVRGTSRIRRNGAVLWEKPFLTGEANMSHAISNLEHHHFKYRQFRRPGAVHIHFFGTATLSFSDSVSTQAGDIFEIEAAPFRLPLRNTIEIESAEAVAVKPL